MDDECSEASGVATVAGVAGVGVATVAGLDGALGALAGGSGFGVTLGLLLRQPMGHWRVLAHKEATHFKKFQARQTHANFWLICSK